MNFETKLKTMTAAYIECAEFCETDEIQGAEFSADAISSARKTCAVFIMRFNNKCAAFSMEQLGHDLWYTRNGHGVGFWSRPEIYGDDLANIYTEYAEKIGCMYAYLGDDKKVYFS